MEVTDEQLAALQLTREEWNELDSTTQEALLIEPESDGLEVGEDDLDAAKKVLGDDADDAAKADDKGDGKQAETKDEAKQDATPPAEPETSPAERQEPLPSIPDFSQELQQIEARRKAIADEQAEIEEKLAEADKQLEEMEIGTPEWVKITRALNKQATELVREEARLEARMQSIDTTLKDRKRENDEIAVQRWKTATDVFMSEPSNKALYQHEKLGQRAHEELNLQLRVLAEVPANANNSFAWFLRRADARVRAIMQAEIQQFGLAKAASPAPAPAESKDRKPSREPKLDDLPPSLGTMPQADIETGEGEFAFLDRLGGEAFMRALERLTPEQRARYEEAGL